MCKYVKLSKSLMPQFKELNAARKSFNSLNEDFFQYYSTTTLPQKLFLRRNISILQDNKSLCGYIWTSIDNKNFYNIRALSVDLSSKSADYLRLLLKTLKPGFTADFLCETNEFNIQLLKEAGFSKKVGTIEMGLDLKKEIKSVSVETISFEVFRKGLDEKIRCDIQNEVFKDKNRVPISTKDIYFDENQYYYFSPGAIFIKENNKYIGYGQVIIEGDIPIIVNVGILPDYRGKGYGKLLINYLLKIIDNYSYNTAIINVDTNNTVAFNLYKDCGFNVLKEYVKLEIKT